jgi:hypothetical protein
VDEGFVRAENQTTKVRANLPLEDPEVEVVKGPMTVFPTSSFDAAVVFSRRGPEADPDEDSSQRSHSVAPR